MIGTTYGISDHGYLKLEIDAVVVHDYQLAHVPGLLQSEDYVRALFCNSRRRLTDAEIDRDVEARLFRRRLTMEPLLELVAIVDESALRRPVVGGCGDADPTSAPRRGVGSSVRCSVKPT